MINDEERRRRVAHVAYANNALRLAGGTPDPDVEALERRFIDGEFDEATLDSLVLALATEKMAGLK